MWVNQRTTSLKLLLVLVTAWAPAAMATEHLNSGAVRVWGEISTTYRVREVGDDESRNSNRLNTGTISASSYLWRPWFALLNGSLSLSTDESDSSGQPATQDEFTTGDAQFDLFPTSRFPFQARYLKSRNEFDTETFSSDVETTEYGLSQRYRSVDGMNNYLADFETREQSHSDSNRFVADSLLLSGGNRFGRQTLSTDIKLDRVDNETSGETFDSHALTFDHGYDSGANLTMDNLLSRSTTENDLLSSQSEVDNAQLLSFAAWHPQDRKDIRLTGSLRFAETRQAEQRIATATDDPIESEIETANANLNQGLIYDYSDNLQLSEAVNASYVETDGNLIYTASESLAARYTPDRYDTRLGDYGWTASSTYSRLHGDVETEHSVDSQFNHSLLNDYSSAGDYQLRTNLTQSFLYQFESEEADEKSVDHSYSVTWSNSASRNQNLVRFFISDSRSLDGDEDFFRLANLQYSGSTRLSRYAQINGNVTLQRTEQREQGIRSSQGVQNGQIEYRHNRVFNVVGLGFHTRLQLSQRQTDAERFIQDLDSGTEVFWENALRYRIGRLESEIELDFVKVGDEYDQLFKFELIRSFGDL